MNDLTQTAKLWSIEPGYRDVFGKWHDSNPQTLTRLVAALSAGRARVPQNQAATELLRAYQGDGRRHWALAVQLYGVRSRRNWGHGDFTDLAKLIGIAAACGVAGIGLNPLHALFPDRAEAASPYAPNSRLFLNPLYVDVEAVPEFRGIVAAELENEVAALRDTPLIAYARVAGVKMAALRSAFEIFQEQESAQRQAGFADFRKERGEALFAFACFEVLRRKYPGTLWQDWPQPWRKPSRAQLAEFRQENSQACEFHEFVQWEADRQLKACCEAAHRLGLPIGLYIDLAVGIDPQGADAWSRQDIVLADFSVGAPPDTYNPSGQNWGLAPINPHALVDDDFESMRQLLRAAMRYAGAIRIDHVLGLKRLFMIPRGSPAADGVYVGFPFEALLRIVAEESNRHRCIVIGEDLGTVPEHFRAELSKWGLWGYRVMMFERDGEGRFLPPEVYPADVLASFNTHDLPSFRGWITGHDLRAKRAIGIDLAETESTRAPALEYIRKTLAVYASDFLADDFAAVAAFLAATPSRLAAVSIEDVIGEVEQTNVPGTVEQHPNWRRKLSVLLEDLEMHEGLLRVARAFADRGRSAA